MMAADVLSHPALLKAVSASAFPAATLVAVLNMRFERKATDVITYATEQSGLGVVASCEHDGVYALPIAPIDDVARWRADVLAAVRPCCAFAEIKPYPSEDAIMSTLEGLTTMAGITGSWDVADADWFVTELSRMELRRRIVSGETSMDVLVGGLIPHQPCDARRLADFRKTVPGGSSIDVAMFDSATGRWELRHHELAMHELSKAGVDVIRAVCGADWTGDLPSWVRKSDEVYACARYALREMYDRDFYAKLDGEEYRAMLMFNCGTALHRDTHELIVASPDIAISRHMGIDYPTEQIRLYEATDVTYEGIEYKLGDFLRETLRLARTHEALIGVYGPGNLDILTARFNLLSHSFDVLSTLYSCFEDWPTTLYLLKQTARGGFAREKYEEAVFHQGAGCNGKGWWDAVLSKTFGSYVFYPGLALLTKSWPAGDKPSPHVVGCKGRLFISITEAEKSSQILSAQFKALRDHSTVLTGRNMYKDLTSFRVQHMLQLSTNIRAQFSSDDGGVERSLAVIEWPMKFVKRPTLDSCERAIKPSLKSDASVHSHAIQLIYVLMQIDDVWRDYDNSRVEPMPVSVVAATARYLNRAEHDQAQEFLADARRVHVVGDARLASTGPQIVRAFAEFMGLKGARALKDARDLLERYVVSIFGQCRSLYRLKGTQSGYVALGPANL
jgi:hypothetical protein